MRKPLTRVWNWPEILSEELAKVKETPFQYGKHDCCLFSANVIKAMTGVDIARGLRGYKSELGAYKMLKNKGKGTLLKTITHIMKEHNCKMVKPLMCQRGDLVIAKITNEKGKKENVAGICIGSQSAFASTNGIEMLSMDYVIRGWHCV